MTTQREVFRVRTEPLPPSELMPARARVTDLDSGLDLGGRIPIEYAPAILTAVVGQPLEVDLFTEDPPVYDPVTHGGRREPVVLLIVERVA